MTSTVILRGTYGTRLAPVARSGGSGPPFAWQARHLDVTKTWQAWHLVTSNWLWWRARAAVDAVVAAAVCVAGVVLGDMHRPFAWQAWHLLTSSVPAATEVRRAG